jgi:hypothetical protein
VIQYFDGRIIGLTTTPAQYRICQSNGGIKVMFIPYQKSIRLVIVPSIKDALGMFKGMNTDNIREEEDEER